MLYCSQQSYKVTKLPTPTLVLSAFSHLKATDNTALPLRDLPLDVRAPPAQLKLKHIFLIKLQYLILPDYICSYSTSEELCAACCSGKLSSCLSVMRRVVRNGISIVIQRSMARNVAHNKSSRDMLCTHDAIPQCKCMILAQKFSERKMQRRRKIYPSSALL